MTSSELNYDSILRVVYTWPATKRFLLVQDLLKTLEPREETPDAVSTLQEALGLLKTDQQPSDEDIAHWLSEHRLEKFGS